MSDCRKTTTEQLSFIGSRTPSRLHLLLASRVKLANGFLHVDEQTARQTAIAVLKFFYVV
ncbi:MAG: hypothetical protein ACAF41_09410 [Leptolyngbya sp. BL-A-14]